MHTIHNLALRLRQSREPTAFLVAQFLAALPTSLKEPEVLNNPIYEDLLLPLPVGIPIQRHKPLGYIIERTHQQCGL